MPKGSEELANARKDEIISACATLYETMSFKDITLRDIGEQTSFTRTSIYNYFQTKEEIFLALMQREYERWAADLEALLASHEAMTADRFADALARTLERRGRLLKLMAMNLYDMEDNSRMENLVALKGAYRTALEAVTVNVAFQYFEERDKGTLAPGKRADLVLLDRDPLAVPPETLRDIQVLETWKDGAPIFRRGEKTPCNFRRED